MKTHDSTKLPEPELEARLAEIERLLGSDPAAADARAAALLERAPGEPMAQLFRGIARRLMREPAEAVAILRSLCDSRPKAPLAHLHLGLAQREAGDPAAAAAALRRAVELRSDFGDAWLALADLLTATGDAPGAGEAYQRYIEQSASDPLFVGAGAALREGRLQDAEAMLRRRIATHPTDVVALCMLADLTERSDRPEEASGLLERCLELAPGYGWARHNHAVMLLRQNRAEEALAESDRMLAADPRNTDFRKLRAAILVRLLEYEESIRICEELLEEDPDQPAVWTSLGHMLKSVGRQDESIRAYRRAVALEPRAGEPWWSLANLKTYRLETPDLDAMREQLAGPRLPERERLHFHFALGRALESHGEYAESFENYAAGNRLRLERGNYRIEELERHVRRSKALLTPEFFTERADFGSPAPDPVFVLGLPRSGSTLVEQILASHSRVEGTMELSNIAAIAKTLDDRERGPEGGAYPDVMARLARDESVALGERYLDETRVHRKLGRPRFIDKMPNNFAHIGLIHLILPRAKIIDVRRHPMACGFSLFKEHFANAQLFSYSLETIGRYYRNYVALMAHFDRVLPGRVHRVVYEALVEDTETEIRRMLDYCDLPFEPACLEFHRNRRAVSTASSEQVRRPIFREGLEQWRHYEPWLDPLRRELGDLPETYRDA